MPPAAETIGGERQQVTGLTSTLLLARLLFIGLGYQAFRQGRPSALTTMVILVAGLGVAIWTMTWSGWAVAWSSLLVIVVFLGVVMIVMWWMVKRSPYRAYYMMHTHTVGPVILGVTAGPGRTWAISDHAAAHPRRGEGRALREALIKPLTDAADQKRITITAVAASARLAKIYLREIPGLKVDSYTCLSGIKLSRDPAPDSLESRAVDDPMAQRH